jgi:glutamine cyclotransferase
VPKIDNQATEAIVKKPKTESSVAKPIGPLYKASDQASYHIIGKYPRAQGKLFFTQGLSFVNSTTLLESSGLNGQSQIHYINNVRVPE